MCIRDRLYSGAVKVPKELTDLQHEVEALGRRRAALEDEELKVMMAVDERQAISAKAAAEVERLAGEFNASVATLKVEQQNLGVHLSKLIEKRGRQAALAQPALLKSYDQLIQEKRGLAVAGPVSYTHLDVYKRQPIPGRFDGCVEYKVGEKAWA